jgi:hypothetical protein
MQHAAIRRHLHKVAARHEADLSGEQPVEHCHMNIRRNALATQYVSTPDYSPAKRIG